MRPVVPLQQTARMEEFIALMGKFFPFPPTQGQADVLRVFATFMASPQPMSVMVLRGSAGTGKTTLTAAIVRMLTAYARKVVLLAPTGRAAKVLSVNAGMPAFTIHRKIYRQKTFEGDFNLNDNLHTDTLFVADEASMIANEGLTQSVFGSGRLLDDLVQYVYNGKGCRLMLIGDTAQLPPVGEEESPALSTAFIQGYGLRVFESDLREVLRQSQQSGILYNATVIRQMITHDEMTQLPRIVFNRFTDIQVVRGDELIEQLATSYSEVGQDETMVVTRSNKRANIYNQGIRNMVLGCEEQLTTGDMLMIVKNNYFWAGADEKAPLQFIANGDRAVIRRVRNVHELYGLHFADLTLSFPDYNDYELTATVLTDSLLSEAPALTPEQNQMLYEGVMADYADIHTKRERIDKVRHDAIFSSFTRLSLLKNKNNDQENRICRPHVDGTSLCRNGTERREQQPGISSARRRCQVCNRTAEAWHRGSRLCSCHTRRQDGEAQRHARQVCGARLLGVMVSRLPQGSACHCGLAQHLC